MLSQRRKPEHPVCRLLAYWRSISAQHTVTRSATTLAVGSGACVCRISIIGNGCSAVADDADVDDNRQRQSTNLWNVDVRATPPLRLWLMLFTICAAAAMCACVACIRGDTACGRVMSTAALQIDISVPHHVAKFATPRR